MVRGKGNPMDNPTSGAPQTVGVTGSGGFIGRHLCRHLQDAGLRVIRIARPEDDASAEISTYLADPRKLADQLRDAGVEALVHAAWAGHPRSAGTDYEGQLAASVVPTIHAMLAAGMAELSHVVILGTGGGIAVRAHGSAAPPAYGWAKRTAEGAATATASAFGYGLTVIRPSAVYGPGQDPARGLGAVTTFAAAIVEGAPVRILGDDSVTRDFLHVADLADAVCQVLLQRACGTFELGGPESVSLGELVRLFEAASGKSADVHRLPATGVDPVSVRLDNTLLTAATGWAPRRRVADSVSELIAALGARPRPSGPAS